MRYLIDGYNLLYQVGVIHVQVGARALEKARVALLDRLAAALGDSAGDAVVVFDARHAPPGTPRLSQHRGVQVHFTRREQADDLIEDLIAQARSPQDLTVVSNDRRIVDSARRRRCTVVECVDFWESLGRPSTATPARANSPEKPEISQDEVQRWLDEFGGEDDDDPLKL